MIELKLKKYGSLKNVQSIALREERKVVLRARRAGNIL